MNHLQQQVQAFVSEHQLEAGLAQRLLDLTSEVGELVKAWLNTTEYGQQPFAAGVAWQEELGDVLFVLICLANATNVDLEGALDNVLDKYERRLDTTGTAHSGR